MDARDLHFEAGDTMLDLTQFAHQSVQIPLERLFPEEYGVWYELHTETQHVAHIFVTGIVSSVRLNQEQGDGRKPGLGPNDIISMATHIRRGVEDCIL